MFAAIEPAARTSCSLTSFIVGHAVRRRASSVAQCATYVARRYACTFQSACPRKSAGSSASHISRVIPDDTPLPPPPPSSLPLLPNHPATLQYLITPLLPPHSLIPPLPPPPACTPPDSAPPLAPSGASAPAVPP